MTERVQKMLEFYRNREYRKLRSRENWDLQEPVSRDDLYHFSTVYMRESLEKEIPVLFEDDHFGFNRHMAMSPGEPIPLTENFKIIQGERYYECISNIVPDYNKLIGSGFDSVISEIDRNLPKVEDKRFYINAKAQLQAITELCDRYRDAAKAQGCLKLHNALCNIPRKGAASFYEACLFQKILIFAMRCGLYKHLAMGRFDQYMLPYFRADLESGITEEELLETLELYFISLNFDTDLYNGIQQGDNGQSIVLGGYDLDGTERFNRLSELCLQASRELCLIDPKINVRVSKATGDAIYASGTKLTKCGLGFPQYCNDDVIVPGLIKLGYAPEDAANYAVAACWEPIIPARGADVPNRSFLSFPSQMMLAIERQFPNCESFELLLIAVEDSIRERCEEMQCKCWGKEKYYFSVGFNPSPFISLMMDGCLEKGVDISTYCLPYHNLGTFGIGISTMADSLYAIKKLIFDEKRISQQQLLDALHANFVGYDSLRNILSRCPKMGDDWDETDNIAVRMMNFFAQTLNGKPTGSGGIWRVGTGSAQMYIDRGKDCSATPDGRKTGEPLSCSFSPAPGARTGGPLSVIRSFTKCDLTDHINGGPITMELHDNVFRNAMGEGKVAQLVKLFVLSGGHQLQLNAINRDKLLEAQKHPEQYPNLIVRVWGWSGYFCELDPQYQDHIISRTEHNF